MTNNVSSIGNTVTSTVTFNDEEIVRASDFIRGFINSSNLQKLLYTEGRVCMACNPMLDYLFGDTTEEQANARIERAFTTAITNPNRKFSDIHFEERVMKCDGSILAARTAKLTDITTHVFMKIFQEYRDELQNILA